jgi:Holliday junction resolvasome RuvABC DNA-binding subunit
MSCTEGVSAAADTGAHVGVPGPGSGGASSVEIKATTKLDRAILRTQARVALTGLGWKPAIARAAVDAAAAEQGSEMTLERLICIARSEGTLDS